MATENRSELVPVGRYFIEAVRTSAGMGWVAIKPACAEMGLDYSAQVKRLKSAPWAVVAVIAITASDGKIYETLCLRADKAAMWFATLDSSRIKDRKLRAELAEIQAGAAEALDAWLRGAPAPASPYSSLTISDVQSMILASEQRQLDRQEALLAKLAKLVPTRSGLLGRTAADEVRSALRQHADVLARGFGHGTREWKRARMRQENRLRHHVGYLRGAWDDCPILPGIVESGVKFLTRDLNLYDRRPRGTQLHLTDRALGHA